MRSLISGNAFHYLIYFWVLSATRNLLICFFLINVITFSVGRVSNLFQNAIVLRCLENCVAKKFKSKIFRSVITKCNCYSKQLLARLKIYSLS